MKTTTASNLRSQLAAYLAHKEPVMVTQKGHMKAVLVPVASEAEAERWVIANNEELFRLLDAASMRVKRSGGVRHDEFWKRIDAKYQTKSNGRGKRKARR